MEVPQNQHGSSHDAADDDEINHEYFHPNEQLQYEQMGPQQQQQQIQQFHPHRIESQQQPNHNQYQAQPFVHRNQGNTPIFIDYDNENYNNEEVEAGSGDAFHNQNQLEYLSSDPYHQQIYNNYEVIEEQDDFNGLEQQQEQGQDSNAQAHVYEQQRQQYMNIQTQSSRQSQNSSISQVSQSHQSFQPGAYLNQQQPPTVHQKNISQEQQQQVKQPPVMMMKIDDGTLANERKYRQQKQLFVQQLQEQEINHGRLGESQQEDDQREGDLLDSRAQPQSDDLLVYSATTQQQQTPFASLQQSSMQQQQQQLHSLQSSQSQQFQKQSAKAVPSEEKLRQKQKEEENLLRFTNPVSGSVVSNIDQAPFQRSQLISKIKEDESYIEGSSHLENDFTVDDDRNLNYKPNRSPIYNDSDFSQNHLHKQLQQQKQQHQQRITETSESDYQLQSSSKRRQEAQQEDSAAEAAVEQEEDQPELEADTSQLQSLQNQHSDSKQALEFIKHSKYYEKYLNGESLSDSYSILQSQLNTHAQQSSRIQHTLVTLQDRDASIVQSNSNLNFKSTPIESKHQKPPANNSNINLFEANCKLVNEMDRNKQLRGENAEIKASIEELRGQLRGSSQNAMKNSGSSQVQNNQQYNSPQQNLLTVPNQNGSQTAIMLNTFGSPLRSPSFEPTAATATAHISESASTSGGAIGTRESLAHQGNQQQIQWRLQLEEERARSSQFKLDLEALRTRLLAAMNGLHKAEGITRQQERVIQDLREVLAEKESTSIERAKENKKLHTITENYRLEVQTLTGKLKKSAFIVEEIEAGKRAAEMEVLALKSEIRASQSKLVSFTQDNNRLFQEISVLKRQLERADGAKIAAQNMLFTNKKAGFNAQYNSNHSSGPITHNVVQSVATTAHISGITSQELNQLKSTIAQLQTQLSHQTERNGKLESRLKESQELFEHEDRNSQDDYYFYDNHANEEGQNDYQVEGIESANSTLLLQQRQQQLKQEYARITKQLESSTKKTMRKGVVVAGGNTYAYSPRFNEEIVEHDHYKQQQQRQLSPNSSQILLQSNQQSISYHLPNTTKLPLQRKVQQGAASSFAYPENESSSHLRGIQQNQSAFLSPNRSTVQLQGEQKQQQQQGYNLSKEAEQERGYQSNYPAQIHSYRQSASSLQGIVNYHSQQQQRMSSPRQQSTPSLINQLQDSNDFLTHTSKIKQLDARLNTLFQEKRIVESELLKLEDNKRKSSQLISQKCQLENKLSELSLSISSVKSSLRELNALK